MQAFYSDHFVLPLPPGHRFPMAKYAMLRESIAQQLPDIALLEAPAASDGQLALAHTPGYIESLVSGQMSAVAMREIGFPWSELMVERARRSVGATVAAVRAALQTGVAANLAGGTHHAYADKGGGFCVFNDVAVAARLAQAEWQQQNRRPLNVAVIDLDVHQGNGTAHIFQRDDSVFTLSLHGDKNFPFRKEASDLDVALVDGCGDADYLVALEQALLELSQRFEPRLVLYLAGADPYQGDRLGRLALTEDGLEARDRRVFDWCHERRIPIAFVMAGGYGRQIEETVRIQSRTFRLGLSYAQCWQDKPGQQVGLDF
ncbi:histone deacetylase [Rhodoferax sp.]|uniref:histone deacetylase family protein n=1 Tax=Rhodoferax sp. TaxID=50421 RepID=UPI0026257FE0|nr:histone deacetylase [Rhodoferax sp.]MDD3937160.1 histone deacetylase [Rhodoferax sp.]